MTLHKNPQDSGRLSEVPTISERALVSECSLGKFTEIAEEVKITESSLGDYSYVMERCEIIYSNIGKFVNIASDVRINPGNHPMEWVSQHHFLYRAEKYGFQEQSSEDFFDWRRYQRVTMGHDVWVGHRAILMPGIRIGNGAVIGAGSLVTKDVAPYTIVAGAPAVKVRKRFPEHIWQAVEEVCWWDWDHATLKERLPDFRDLRRFLALYGKRG